MKEIREVVSNEVTQDVNKSTGEVKMSKKDKEQLIVKIENEMKEAAKMLEFEYAAELRKRVIDLGIIHRASKVSDVMTISQGICWDVPEKGCRMWDFLHAADDMLYRVKQKSRNHFCIGNLKEVLMC